MTEVIGLIAAICTTFSFAPQALKVIKTGDTSGLSLAMYVIFTFGVLLWIGYGLMREDAVIVLANVVTFVLAAIILFLKIRNDVLSNRK
ncbi:SemiSWEET family sugar transporter [Teredinibacter waterburyi]|jgi:Uncharacterized conserved protein|uniref:SemiSWEET family sugar transporter n=1 Tax=Teredinibacter waterburyi TaxID=1500538 RepID=UPI001CAA896F|nr:SemiSWEET transporter [Teredinibacter waterburyi]